MAKIQPSVLTLNFTWNFTPDDQGIDYRFIDISQVASIANRRFYRQGLNWGCAGMKLMTNGSQAGATQTLVMVSKLPTTWVFFNAWEKSFRAWMQMIKNATDESGAESIKGKFLDFKIYANENHHTSGYGANLMPYSNSTGAYSVATPGQWQPSSVEMPQAGGTSTEFELLGVGPNNPGAGASGFDAKSLIAGYANSRSLPYNQDPNSPGDADDYTENWMLGLFSEGNVQDEEVLDMLGGHGDRAPYPYEGDGVNLDTMYPGGETQMRGLIVHDLDLITPTTVGGTSYLKGGMIPCGLLQVQTVGFTPGDVMEFQLDLLPGNHRGYAAVPMQDV